MGDPAGPCAHRAREDPFLQSLLPRLGRRVADRHHAGRRRRARPGNVGAPVDVTSSSRVAEFNDLTGLERELAHGDVAALLMEPALTNIGIILPEAGYLADVRELTRQYGTLPSTTRRTRSAPGLAARPPRGGEPGPGHDRQGDRRRYPGRRLRHVRELADRLLGRSDLDLIDVGGVGGTLAGNALSVAAVCATLSQVLTDEAFGEMITLAERFADGVAGAISRYGLPWSVTRLGPAPSTASPVRRRAPAPKPPRRTIRSSTTTCTRSWPTGACC